MAKVYLISLGCDKNRIDAEIMAKKLQDAGYTLSDELQKSDIAVVNTCGFIEAAKTEAIDTILEVAAHKNIPGSSLKKIVVTGCLAERYREELAELIPEADAVIGIGRNGDIAALLRETEQGARPVVFAAPEQLPVEGERLLSTPAHYAYLKIAEGCGHRCTYCAIPSIRGTYRSRPESAVVAEANRLVKNGVKELILVAQDTTAYGGDRNDGSGLAKLLQQLAAIDGVWKVRILYAYPDGLTEDVLAVMAASPRIARYLDIPMQHADSTVLRRMARFGDEGQLTRLIETIRSRLPDAALRSSFIVGFPGESEEQFLTLLGFLERAKLDRAGCFVFSPEEGTPAEKLKERVPADIAEQRAETFMRRQTEILAQKQREKIGRTLEAICDGYDEERDMYICRTEYDAPEVDTLFFVSSARDIASGEIISATVTGSDEYDLFGTLV